MLSLLVCSLLLTIVFALNLPPTAPLIPPLARPEVFIEVKTFPPSSPSESYYRLEFVASGEIPSDDIIPFSTATHDETNCQFANLLSSTRGQIIPLFPEFLARQHIGSNQCNSYFEDPSYSTPTHVGYLMSEFACRLSFHAQATIPANSIISCLVSIPDKSSNGVSPQKPVYLDIPDTKNIYHLKNPCPFYRTDSLASSLTWLGIEHGYTVGQVINGNRIDAFSTTYFGLPARSMISLDLALSFVGDDRLDKLLYFERDLVFEIADLFDLVEGSPAISCGKDVRLVFDSEFVVTFDINRFYIITGFQPDPEAKCEIPLPIFSIMRRVIEIPTFSMDQWQGANIAVYSRLNANTETPRNYLYETTQPNAKWNFNTIFTFSHIHTLSDHRPIYSEQTLNHSGASNPIQRVEGDPAVTQVLLSFSLIVPTRAPTIEFGDLLWVPIDQRQTFMTKLFTTHLKQFTYTTSPHHRNDPSKQIPINVHKDPFKTTFDLTSKPYHNITMSFLIPVAEIQPWSLELVITNRAQQRMSKYIGITPQLGIYIPQFVINQETKTVMVDAEFVYRDFNVEYSISQDFAQNPYATKSKLALTFPLNVEYNPTIYFHPVRFSPFDIRQDPTIPPSCTIQPPPTPPPSTQQYQGSNSQTTPETPPINHSSFFDTTSHNSQRRSTIENDQVKLKVEPTVSIETLTQFIASPQIFPSDALRYIRVENAPLSGVLSCTYGLVHQFEPAEYQMSIVVSDPISEKVATASGSFRLDNQTNDDQWMDSRLINSELALYPSSFQKGDKVVETEEMVQDNNTQCQTTSKQQNTGQSGQIDRKVDSAVFEQLYWTFDIMSILPFHLNGNREKILRIVSSIILESLSSTQIPDNPSPTVNLGLNPDPPRSQLKEIDPSKWLWNRNNFLPTSIENNLVYPTSVNLFDAQEISSVRSLSTYQSGARVILCIAKTDLPLRPSEIPGRFRSQDGVVVVFVGSVSSAGASVQLNGEDPPISHERPGGMACQTDSNCFSRKGADPVACIRGKCAVPERQFKHAEYALYFAFNQCHYQPDLCFPAPSDEPTHPTLLTGQKIIIISLFAITGSLCCVLWYVFCVHPQCSRSQSHENPHFDPLLESTSSINSLQPHDS